MTATKILWGQVLVVFLIVLAAVWGATQWVAWRLGYQAQLGQPMDVWGGVPVYRKRCSAALVRVARVRLGRVWPSTTA